MDEKTLSYLGNVLAFVILFSLGYWIVKRVSKIKPKNKSDEQTKLLRESFASLGLIISMVVVGIILYFIVGAGLKSVTGSVTGFFGGKSDAKEYCAKHRDVINAKTDFAAKKAYKACLRNY